ncbi:MAG: hypothetical protein DRQ10_01850 [Candidatus Hydrothermota bacterium]|nr:MAG: hypothetical protein DRQ10_01850 [Candidatus Hydrothermae bacterium]
MNHFGAVFYIGLILLVGYYSGRLANMFRLPRVSGYIIAGMLLSPSMLKIFPKEFVAESDVLTDFALAMITYSIGGSLAVRRLKRLGKQIFWITIFEAETAFILMILGFTVIMPFFFGIKTSHEFFHVALPLALIIGAMASPTDPTATLAVVHEYGARGPLTSTLLGVAASDDALGIINYSLAIGIASVLILGKSLNPLMLVALPIKDILTSIVVGAVGGYILTRISANVRREGAILSIILGILFLVFGISKALKADPLLSTMITGAVVVNLCRVPRKMFESIERYYEEVVFILFFVVSGAHVQLAVLFKAGVLVACFVMLRLIGKAVGTMIGGKLSHTDKKIYKNLWLGLIPQGGIVVGLALATVHRPEFKEYSSLVMNLILGTTAFHELFGPIFAKMAIQRAHEMRTSKDEG